MNGAGGVLGEWAVFALCNAFHQHSNIVTIIQTTCSTFEKQHEQLTNSLHHYST